MRPGDGPEVAGLVGLVIAVPSLIALALAPTGAESARRAAAGMSARPRLGCIGRRRDGQAAAQRLDGAHSRADAGLVVLLVGATRCSSGSTSLRRHAGRSARSRPTRSGCAKSPTQKRPIYVDAYISANRARGIRQDALQPGLDAQGAGAAVRQPGVASDLHDNLELFSEEAAQAEQRFGIQRQTIASQARGAFKEEEFIMGVAFTCGLEKVVLPFVQARHARRIRAGPLDRHRRPASSGRSSAWSRPMPR